LVPGRPLKYETPLAAVGVRLGVAVGVVATGVAAVGALFEPPHAARAELRSVVAVMATRMRVRVLVTGEP